ncbi:AAA family ATPase [Alicyclobacillus fodiniaquatilis]|uniref:AAA family ATPase n=1 Tax=Alicyclobacillus fodiniaquatilis TaxID=1661150 RepID=A0ABW4JJP1_9BACL
MDNYSVDSTIYLISGPCGVGKSTVSKEVAQRIPRSVLLIGDNLLHMYQGYDAPWEERLSLAWTNILSVTRNFIRNGWNIVIDFVVEDELEWFIHELEDMSVSFHYIVLVADETTLLERINRRGSPELSERSLFLLNKLKKSDTNRSFLYDTSSKSPTIIAEDILCSNHFRMLYRPHGKKEDSQR